MNKYSNIKKVLLLAATLFFGFSTVVLADPISSYDLNSLQTDSMYDDTSEVSACSADSSAASSSPGLSGKDNSQKAYNFFIGKGLKPYQAAAIVGNLSWESAGVNPKVNQGSGGPGRGIAQWSVDGRWVNLLAFAKKQTDPALQDPYSLNLQLMFVWAELNGTPPAGDYKYALADLRNQTNISDATLHFMGTAASGGNINGYENPGTPYFSKRLDLAKNILASNGGSSGDSGVSGLDAPTCGGGSAAAGSVNCSGGSAAGSSLSPIRQKVVCLTEAELKLWTSGKLSPGSSQPYDFLKYSQGRNEEWCSDFVSWIYNQAGYPLQPGNSGNVAAVESIRQIGAKNGNFHYHAAGGYTPKPGDLVIHQDGESHVNMVVSVNTNSHSMTVIGGNQAGTSTANNTSRVSKYTVNAFSGTNGISGYVSPD